MGQLTQGYGVHRDRMIKHETFGQLGRTEATQHHDGVRTRRNAPKTQRVLEEAVNLTMSAVSRHGVQLVLCAHFTGVLLSSQESAAALDVHRPVMPHAHGDSAIVIIHRNNNTLTPLHCALALVPLPFHEHLHLVARVEHAKCRSIIVAHFSRPELTLRQPLKRLRGLFVFFPQHALSHSPIRPGHEVATTPFVQCPCGSLVELSVNSRAGNLRVQLLTATSTQPRPVVMTPALAYCHGGSCPRNQSPGGSPHTTLPSPRSWRRRWSAKLW
mmetsp:Transcript_33414/g.77592  ORF Transcript_33414/g.77592 Transcript_33414/m.77592 type:complete len:271 (+) Transcript_33414:1371-2183(+)